jgi:replicative superfamily II helicase
MRQMMGRAGREHHERGVVELVVSDEDEGVIHEMLEQGSTTVVSSLQDPDILAMSLIPEIYRGSVTDTASARAWCARSFCPNPPLQKALELLREVEAIRSVQGRLEATIVGSCAAQFYFHPADVFAWHHNFTTMFDLGLEDDEVAPAWALGNIPFDRVVGDLGDKRYLATECKSKTPLGLRAMKGSAINVVAWWYLLGGPSPGAIRPACLERRKNFGRYRAALEMLNRHANWDTGDYFQELELRVKKGLRPPLVPLCKFEGMTKGRADYLYNLGIRSGPDFASVVGRLDDDIDDDFKETIERIARECSKTGN